MPKRAGPASDTPSLPSTFFPGSSGLIIPPFVHPPQQPKKKKAPPPMAPNPEIPRFTFGAAVSQSTTTVPSFVKKPPFTPRRNFLYDKHTDEPYAEWIGNEAVCLDTGEVLFESKRGVDCDEQFGQKPAVQFDYSPPTQTHPKDPSIASLDLVNAGILKIDDFKNGSAGLSLEMVKRYKDGLPSV